MKITIKELNKENISLCNSVSHFESGNVIEKEYKNYCNEIITWEIPDIKKIQFLEKTYKYFEEMLRLRGKYTPVNVCGGARYDAKKESANVDRYLEKSNEFYLWFKEIKEQVEKNKNKEKVNIYDKCIKYIENEKEKNTHIDIILDSAIHFLNYAIKEKDDNSFIKIYEYIENEKLKKFRKNSSHYKLYSQLKNGETLNTKEEIYNCEFFESFIENERVFIKFFLKPKRQLIVALKSRGYFWNAHKQMWSTYLKKLDIEWIKSIEEKYKDYL